MKNIKVKMLVLLIISLAVNPVFSDTTLEALQNGVNEFAESMANALPFNSTMGLNWSDGYIGQITSVPPHFGIGISAGVTTMNFDSFKKMLELFGVTNMPFDSSMIQNMGFPIPGYTVEGRIGGAILPFDIGLKFGYLPQDAVKSLMEDYGSKYMLLGADFRYSLLNKKILIPKLSIGLGFNYMEGGITAPLPLDLSYTFKDTNNNNYTLTSLDKANIGLEWRTVNVEFKAQASFPFKFITPYAGAGVSYAWSRAGYKVTAKLLVDNNSISEDIKKILMEQLKVTNVSDKGFETIKNINHIGARAFGGLSINIAFFRIDITGMYEFIGGHLGGTLGMRFQL